MLNVNVTSFSNILYVGFSCISNFCIDINFTSCGGKTKRINIETPPSDTCKLAISSNGRLSAGPQNRCAKCSVSDFWRTLLEDLFSQESTRSKTNFPVPVKKYKSKKCLGLDKSRDPSRDPTSPANASAAG